ncbi:MAG TPA: hypothetical protein VGK31_11650 [Thermoanaerobaculia bacterium]|jgi:Na+-transporting NADH:ubiquinone oxidoreductase subunit NqrB
MNREFCQRYLEDPEANAAHLAECEKCRALADSLQSSVLVQRSSDVRELPLAAWEGAGHRSWPLVAAGLIVVALIAAFLFMETDSSPWRALANLPSADVLISTLRHMGSAAQNAPASWQLVVGILFVIVNAIFIALLRRAPRGIDV